MGRRGPVPESTKAELYKIREPSTTSDGTPIVAIGLDKHAQQLWDEVYPELMAVGFIKATDSHQLRAMCEWWSEYVQLRDSEDKMAEVMGNLASALRKMCEHAQGEAVSHLDAAAQELADIAGSYSGGAKQRLEMMSKAWNNFHLLASKFGMTPSDRTRLSTTKKPPKVLTPIEELMERRKARSG